MQLLRDRVSMQCLGLREFGGILTPGPLAILPFSAICAKPAWILPISTISQVGLSPANWSVTAGAFVRTWGDARMG
jgi:hypothetical protein